MASEYDPKISAIGISEMLVRERLSSDLPTYEIGYPELKMIIQEKYPFPIQVDAKNHPPASGERFTVRMSDKSSFDALKNQDDTQDNFLNFYM